MRLVPVILVVVLVGVLLHSGSEHGSLVSCYDEFLKEDYFAFLPEGLVIGTKGYDEIYRAIEQLDIASKEDVHKTYDIINRAREATNEQSFKGVYSSLLQLASKDNTCKQDMVSDYLSIYALMKYKKDGSLDKLVGYMTQMGKRKFAQCASKLEQDFDPARVEPFEVKWDEFYLAALSRRDDIRFGASDMELYGLVRGFNLAKDRFDSQKAFQVARKQTRATTPLKVLNTFYKYRCSNIKSELWLELNILNLATSLGSYHIQNEKLLKINEYNRICNTWSDIDLTKEVNENIQRQL